MWTEVNGGKWTNITGISADLTKLTNYDSQGLLDTYWIGDKLPQSVHWTNYSIFTYLKFFDKNQTGYVGFIFGATNAIASYCMF